MRLKTVLMVDLEGGVVPDLRPMTAADVQRLRELLELVDALLLDIRPPKRGRRHLERPHDAAVDGLILCTGLVSTVGGELCAQ